MKWSYGITTVLSRRAKALPRTLLSLKHAGFDKPRLFLDGASHAEAESYEEQFGLPVTVRGPEPVRVCANWWLGMAELYFRDPQADRFAMFQDDLLAVQNLRPYLDALPWPDQRYFNLYAGSGTNEPIVERAQAQDVTGWVEAGIKDPSQINPDDGLHWQKGIAALALCFPRDLLVRLLGRCNVFEKAQSRDGWRRIDGTIVDAMNAMGCREMIHCPSLVQHEDDGDSTIRNIGRRLARSFPGEMYNALDFLKKKQR